MSMLPSEAVAVVGSVDPDAYATANDYSSGWISAANFHAYMAVVQVGDIGISGSVTAKIEQASDSSGTGAKDLTGSDVTALTGVGADHNKQAAINFRQHQLDTANSFNHFRLTITLADDGASPTGLSSDFSGVVLGCDPRIGPASDNDATTVDEIITV